MIIGKPLAVNVKYSGVVSPTTIHFHGFEQSTFESSATWRILVPDL